MNENAKDDEVKIERANKKQTEYNKFQKYTLHVRADGERDSASSLPHELATRTRREILGIIRLQTLFASFNAARHTNYNPAAFVRLPRRAQ